jgi:cell division septation protein DedD
MKKYLILCAGLCMILALGSCKSKESAYRKAYDAANANEGNTTTTTTGYDDTPVVTPFVETPATAPSVSDNSDNVAVRTEQNLQVVSGSGLKAYSVVVGSFSVKSNAENLVQRLRASGYDA